jgi:DNA-directed RNA polymerase II subunit RPB7
MKFNPDATPPHFSNSDGEVIERGSAIRVQLFGIRSDVNNITAVAKMSGNWLGYVTYPKAVHDHTTNAYRPIIG